MKCASARFSMTSLSLNGIFHMLLAFPLFLFVYICFRVCINLMGEKKVQWPLKTRFGLELVPRGEHSTHQPIA